MPFTQHNSYSRSPIPTNNIIRNRQQPRQITHELQNIDSVSHTIDLVNNMDINISIFPPETMYFVDAGWILNVNIDAIRSSGSCGLSILNKLQSWPTGKHLILRFLQNGNIVSEDIITNISNVVNRYNVVLGSDTSIWNNKYLKNLEGIDDFIVWVWWSKWIQNTTIRIARDLKNLFFIIASLYLLIIVLKLLFSQKSEEEIWNFKKWIIWISVWIIITQISYSFIYILFDKNIDSTLAWNFINTIIEPLIWLLEITASFFFLSIMIFTFYRLISANWNEEKIKSAKESVFYALFWFFLIQISKVLVSSIFWKTICVSNETCINTKQITNLSWISTLIVDIINWLNWFVWIIVILMIIYAWFLIFIFSWDEEKIKKAKNIILYIIIWLFILSVNYIILTFFILPETTI